MNDMTDADYEPTNREKIQKTKKHKFWCGCDRQIVGELGKCPVCGRYNRKNKRRIKGLI
jgi:hypothetical protein